MGRDVGTGGEKGEITRRHKGTFGMMEMFSVLIMVSRVYTHEIYTVTIHSLFYVNYTPVKLLQNNVNVLLIQKSVVLSDIILNSI